MTIIWNEIGAEDSSSLARWTNNGKSFTIFDYPKFAQEDLVYWRQLLNVSQKHYTFHKLRNLLRSYFHEDIFGTNHKFTAKEEKVIFNKFSDGVIDPSEGGNENITPILDTLDCSSDCSSTQKIPRK